MRPHVDAVACLLITALLLGLVLARLALAQGDPHGDYSSITGACGACHRTHTGFGTDVLYSSAPDNAFCFTCHNGTGAPAVPVVSTHSNIDFDWGVEANFELRCVQCHDPHGSLNNLFSIKQYVLAADGAPPVMSGPVVFTGTVGINSYDDGVSDPVSRVCVTCHVNSGNPGYPMTSHTGGANHHGGGDYSGQDCTTCHAHSVDDDRYTLDGFMADCTSCHGQPPNGTSAPNRDGSHTTHFTPTSFGPQIDPGICDDCHYFSAATHIDGQVTFADGQPLSSTITCDDCHSPGGDYDGVNDALIGAKSNWDSGVYTDNNLVTGKEKWCAGCHDDDPSTVRGVSAPNVIGDENAVTNYGLGYGFYKTGHGLPANQSYPASGGTVQGASISCGYCHDFGLQHTDGLTRTYQYTAVTGAADDYQNGYRLESIDGQLPLIIPRIGTCADSGVNVTEFRLCFSCHESEPFSDSNNYATNFRRTGTPDFNAHNYHLSIMFACDYGPVFSSDWSYATWDSRASCVTCHNVHGSYQLAMARDGKLINREPGLELLYYDPSVSFDCYNYPDKRDVSLPESTGTIWAQNVSGLCSTCHGSCGLDSVYYRSTPPQIARAQGQIGSDVLTVEFSEGVYGDPGASGGLTIGDLALTDLDNGRVIMGLAHNAGDDYATLTLDSSLDASDDIDTDTLAAATATSIYDAASTPMDTTPVALTGPDAVPQTLALHPSGLDSTTSCVPVGGVWADILDSNDGATTHADCFSYQDTGPGGGFFPAQYQVDLDDPSGLGGATINQLVARAIVDVTEVTGGGGPSVPLAYMQICYDTGGASQECSVVYDLDGTEGWVQIWIGNTVDPDGNPLDLDDLNNLRVQVQLEADNCCGDATARAYVTEVYAEVDYTLVTDLDSPALSNQNPPNGASGVNVGDDLTFTLIDNDSGVDWMTFEVELVGSKGYSELYTDADYFTVSKTGSSKNYDVTVNPDVDFGGEETISVTIRVDDYAGNPLAHPAWSFTTLPAPSLQTVILHPSDVADDGGYTVTGGTWANVLDTNDGDASHVYFCCSSPGQTFYVDMDDPALSNVIINDLTVHVYARYVDGASPSPPVIAGDLDIGYRTGMDTVWNGSTTTDASGQYNLISSATYSLDSDSGSLDLVDINNLQIAVTRKTSGSANLRVTEVYVEVTYQASGDDTSAPTLSNQNPANGATDVAADSNLTFTLEDSGYGVDWTTFSIQMLGDMGFSQTYTDQDTGTVSQSGSPASYDVTVNPDADFGNEELITVIIDVDDQAGNSLVSPAWSFMTAATVLPQMISLHPSGLVSNPGGYWTVPIADQWATYLDSNDGDITYVTSNTGAEGAIFTVDMDNPSGLAGATIQSLTFHIYARYVSGWAPIPPAVPGVVDIGYQTGTNTMWIGDTSVDDSGNYNLVSSSTYTTDSDGGPLDLVDLNNLQIAVIRRTSGGYPLRVTEIYAEVTYVP